MISVAAATRRIILQVICYGRLKWYDDLCISLSSSLYTTSRLWHCSTINEYRMIDWKKQWNCIAKLSPMKEMESVRLIMIMIMIMMMVFTSLLYFAEVIAGCKHCKPKIKCCTVKELILDEVSKYVNIMHTWRLIDWL